MATIIILFSYFIPWFLAWFIQNEIQTIDARSLQNALVSKPSEKTLIKWMKVYQMKTWDQIYDVLKFNWKTNWAYKSISNEIVESYKNIFHDRQNIVLCWFSYILPFIYKQLYLIYLFAWLFLIVLVLWCSLCLYILALIFVLGPRRFSGNILA